MSCCIEKDGSTLEVTLVFRREELLYDIKNAAYIESHIMPPDAEHARHMVADVGEDGNADRVTRVLDLGVSMCREMLYPWANLLAGYRRVFLHYPIPISIYVQNKAYCCIGKIKCNNKPFL